MEMKDKDDEKSPKGSSTNNIELPLLQDDLFGKNVGKDSKDALQ